MPPSIVGHEYSSASVLSIPLILTHQRKFPNAPVQIQNLAVENQFLNLYHCSMLDFGKRADFFLNNFWEDQNKWN